VAERIGRAAWVVIFVFAIAHVAIYAAGAWGIERLVAIQSAIDRVRIALDVLVGAAICFHAGRVAGPLVRGDADAAFGEGKTRLWWTARVATGITLAFLVFHVWDQRLRLGLRAPPATILVQELAARASSTVAGVGVLALLLVAGGCAAGAHLALAWMSRAHARAPLDGQRRRNVQFAAIGVVAATTLLSAFGAVSIATGQRFGAAPEADIGSGEPCPAPKPPGSAGPGGSPGSTSTASATATSSASATATTTASTSSSAPRP
jgi:hypothetical protein